MYLVCKLELDPSQKTEIKKIKAGSGFSKFLDMLTFGQVGKKIESETFTAVTFIENIYSALNSIGVNNIIRLAVDDYDFYFDDSGKGADMEDAMEKFKIKVDPISSELFDTIYLVMEHDFDNLKLLIEIQLKRKHTVGEYPAIFNINAEIKDFVASSDKDLDNLKNKISGIFSNQKYYDEFVDRAKKIFDTFVAKLINAIKEFIPIDDLRRETAIQIIRPKTKIKNKNAIIHSKKSKPVYYGYYGYDDYFLYSWLWGDMMYQHNIYTRNVDIVDEEGNKILHIGEKGLNVGESNLLNVDVPFEVVRDDDIDYFPNNQYADDIKSQGINFDD